MTEPPRPDAEEEREQLRRARELMGAPEIRVIDGPVVTIVEPVEDEDQH